MDQDTVRGSTVLPRDTPPEEIDRIIMQTVMREDEEREAEVLFAMIRALVNPVYIVRQCPLPTIRGIMIRLEAATRDMLPPIRADEHLQNSSILKFLRKLLIVEDTLNGVD